MAQVNSIDSNVTGLRYARETSYKVLPATPTWIPLEPNSYEDFGGQITTVARNPINPSRQRKKGVVTDLDASGGFETDLTQSNLQDLLQGFFFADLRRKGDTLEPSDGALQIPITAVNGTTEEYTLSNLQATVAVVAVGGTGYTVGDVLTLVGGTFTTSAQLTVLTVSAGVVLTVSISRPGRYTVAPGNPVATTGGTGTGATFTMTFGATITLVVGDLIFGAGFTNSANNGLKRITVVTTANVVFQVAENLITETPSATAATLTRVGRQAAAGDLDISLAGSLPAITSTVLNFTTLGLIPGEWIFIGGDSATLRFANAVNNGHARIRSIAANTLTLDKTENTMVTEASTTETVQLFFGRVLKNELGTLVKRRTYNLERELGAPDNALPTEVQAEYIVGAVPGEFIFNIPTAEKVTCSLSFVGADNETIDGPTPNKSGNRPALVEADAFNTSSNFSRIKMAQVIAGSSNPTALFAFVTDMTVSINNNISPNKAIGVLGAFEVTAGTFEIGGELTAYFSNVSAIQAVRSNADITLDVHMVKANAGISIDIPLITLGEGRPSVEQDEPITLPFSMAAATAAKIDPTLDHTLLMVFFDFLPTLAD